MPLIDSHAHIDSDSFQEDLPEVLARARECDVVAIVTVGTDEDSSRRACALAEREKDVWFAPGIHPHDADRTTSTDPLREWSSHPRAVAIGETGLDYFKRYASHENQKKLFLSHLALSQEVQKPVIIHCRDAHQDTIEILRSEGVTRGVIHCFSGNADHAARYIELGFYLSIAGPVTYKNAHDLREAVRTIPLDRLLVETDCPLLAPQAHRGKRNEPAYVRYTATEVARVQGRSPEEIGVKTTENARSLFNL